MQLTPTIGVLDLLYVTSFDWHPLPMMSTQHVRSTFSKWQTIIMSEQSRQLATHNGDKGAVQLLVFWGKKLMSSCISMWHDVPIKLVGCLNKVDAGQTAQMATNDLYNYWCSEKRHQQASRTCISVHNFNTNQTSRILNDVDKWWQRTCTTAGVLREEAKCHQHELAFQCQSNYHSYFIISVLIHQWFHSFFHPKMIAINIAIFCVRHSHSVHT